MFINGLRYGSHSEQRFFVDETLKDLHKQIIFNATLVAYSPAGVAALVAQKNLKPFIIDPQLYIFQSDPTKYMKNDKIKVSVQKLAECYGSVISANIERGYVGKEELSDPDVRREIVTNCLNFQRSFILEKAQEQDYWEFIEYVYGEDCDIAKPHAVVAPALYIGTTSDLDNLTVNQKLVLTAKEMLNEDEILAQEIIVSKYNFESFDDQIISNRIKGVETLFWVDDFSEHNESIESLRRYARFMRKIEDKHIYLLYGSFFSLAIAKFYGIIDITIFNGVEYGESRGLYPIGGGIPRAKYYLPHLHKRINYDDLYALCSAKGWLDSSDAFFENVCNCPICVEVIADNPREGIKKFGEGKVSGFFRGGQYIEMEFPTAEAKDLTARHYLHAKRKEYDLIEGSEIIDLRGKWESFYKEIEGLIDENDIMHLLRWSKVLK